MALKNIAETILQHPCAKLGRMGGQRREGGERASLEGKTARRIMSGGSQMIYR